MTWNIHKLKKYDLRLLQTKIQKTEKGRKVRKMEPSKH